MHSSSQRWARARALHHSTLNAVNATLELHDHLKQWTISSPTWSYSESPMVIPGTLQIPVSFLNPSPIPTTPTLPLPCLASHVRPATSSSLRTLSACFHLLSPV